jgi:hypothetical protein
MMLIGGRKLNLKEERMTKLLCDRCGREVPELKELHLIRVTNCETDKPTMPAFEVCVFCKVEMEPFIRYQRPKEITNA